VRVGVWREARASFCWRGEATGPLSQLIVWWLTRGPELLLRRNAILTMYLDKCLSRRIIKLNFFRRYESWRVKTNSNIVKARVRCDVR
jgi:hypothetical protein